MKNAGRLTPPVCLSHSGPSSERGESRSGSTEIKPPLTQDLIDVLTAFGEASE